MPLAFCFQQSQPLASAGAPGTGTPAPSASCFQQPQQVISIGAPGKGMLAPSASRFQQPLPLASTGAPGTGLQALDADISSNHSSSLQQGLLAPGCQFPPSPIPSNYSSSLQSGPQLRVAAPYAGMQGSSISQLHQSQQLMSAGVVGTGTSAPVLPTQQATTRFALSTATHAQPHQNQKRASAFPRLLSTAPPAPIPRKQVSSALSVIFPVTNGMDKMAGTSCTKDVVRFAINSTAPDAPCSSAASSTFTPSAAGATLPPHSRTTYLAEASFS